MVLRENYIFNLRKFYRALIRSYYVDIPHAKSDGIPHLTEIALHKRSKAVEIRDFEPPINSLAGKDLDRFLRSHMVLIVLRTQTEIEPLGSFTRQLFVSYTGT